MPQEPKKMVEKTSTQQAPSRPQQSPGTTGTMHASTHTSTAYTPGAACGLEHSEPEHGGQTTTEKVREQARAAADRARGALGEAAESAKHATGDAARRARHEAQSFISRQKDTAADEISHVGEAVRRAADQLRADNDLNVAHYADLAAEQVNGAANYLRQRDLTELASDVQGLARRHPAALCGGMFIAGMAMARFLKAAPPATAYASTSNIDQPGARAALPARYPATQL